MGTTLIKRPELLMAISHLKTPHLDLEVMKIDTCRFWNCYWYHSAKDKESSSTSNSRYFSVVAISLSVLCIVHLRKIGY